ncbi:MAG: glycosyltransferase family 4 protein, partial [Verrucomicrobiia bacterium]
PSLPDMKVWFSEGDTQGWAIDEDLRLLRAALGGQVTETSLAAAEVVVAVWWWKLLRIPPRRLANRHVIALADNPPFRYIRHPSFIQGAELVDLWVGRSAEAVRQFEVLGLPVVHAPYAVDLGLFRPLQDRSALRARFRKQHSILQDTYLVGNFHRDTEGGPNGGPKIQKAPELFLRIVLGLMEAGLPVHVVLAGPRRHWLRKALGDANVPFTFVGDAGIKGDDYPANILERSELNHLYNVIDLYCITSRWEGGPHSVLEAGAAGCPVISTPVGVAADLLPDGNLFNSVKEGVAAAQRIFARAEASRETAMEVAARVKANHSPEALGKAFHQLASHTSRLESGRKAKAIRWRFRPDLPGWAPAVQRLIMRQAGRGKLHLRPPKGDGACMEELFLWMQANAPRFGQRIVGEHETRVIITGTREGLVLANGQTGRRIEVFFDFQHFLSVVSPEKLSSGILFADRLWEGWERQETPIVRESLSGPEPMDVLGDALFQALAMIQRERV